MEPDIEAQIAQEIFTVLQRLGAEPELLSIISHWRDTLDDREVFWMLREYNTTRRVPQPRGGRTGRSAGQSFENPDRTILVMKNSPMVAN